MSPLLISLAIFASVFGGSLLGILLHFRLPDRHLAPESRDVVRLSMGLVTTMVAIALGLLIGSAKTFYDTQNTEVAQLAANAVLLDRLLAHYGPEAQGARVALRNAVSTFSRPNSQQLEQQFSAPGVLGEVVLNSIQELSPKDDNQRSLRSQAVGIAIQMGQTKWLMLEQRAVPLPVILIGVLVFWLIVLFISFGLFAEPNATLMGGLLIASLAMSAAVFLIIEMYNPYTGLIQVSDAPIQAALLQLGH
jgi:hypothetical protein